MATMADDAIFLDTNILVYAELATSTFYGVARKKLEELYSAGRSFWISRQIIREYLVTTTRAHSGPKAFAATEAAAGVQKLLQIVTVANENADVTTQLLELVRQFSVTGKQIHDANIVATMLVYKIPRLLTHNRSDFDRYQPLIEVSSFQQ